MEVDVKIPSTSNIVDGGIMAGSTAVGIGVVRGSTLLFSDKMKNYAVQGGILALSIAGIFAIKGQDNFAKASRSLAVGTGAGAVVNMIEQVAPQFLGTASDDDSQAKKLLRASATGKLNGNETFHPMPNMTRTYNAGKTFGRGKATTRPRFNG